MAKSPSRNSSRRADGKSKSRSPAPKGMAGKGKSSTLALQNGAGQTPLERARAAKAAKAIADGSMDADDLRDV